MTFNRLHKNSLYTGCDDIK